MSQSGLLRFLIAVVCALGLRIEVCGADGEIPHWEELDSGVRAGMRGISTVSQDVAWASGTSGTVIKTVDGGNTWEKVKFSVLKYYLP